MDRDRETMDRDRRWDRNKVAWDAIVLGRGRVSDAAPSEAVRAAYASEPRGDEFLAPIILCEADRQRIRDGDVIIPTGETRVQPGDSIIAVVTYRALRKAEAMLASRESGQ